MKISFAITVCNEFEEIKQLVPFLIENKRVNDEIVILFDNKNGDERVLNYLLEFNKLPNVQTWQSMDFNNDFSEWKNKLNDLVRAKKKGRTANKPNGSRRPHHSMRHPATQTAYGKQLKRREGQQSSHT